LYEPLDGAKRLRGERSDRLIRINAGGTGHQMIQVRTALIPPKTELEAELSAARSRASGSEPINKET